MLLILGAVIRAVVVVLVATSPDLNWIESMGFTGPSLNTQISPVVWDYFFPKTKIDIIIGFSELKKK